MTTSRLIASPVLLVVVIGVVAKSMSALAILASGADTRDLAASIENGSRPDANYLARFIQNNGLDRQSAACSDALTRARLTVGIAALDAAVNANDAELVDAAQKNALEIARHRLSCNPLDGNAWLRFAMIDVQANGAVPEAIDALRLSYWLAPNESWVMEARLAFATRLYLDGISDFESEYLEDLRRFATYEPISQVAKTYVETAPQIRALLHPLIAAQSDARNRTILAEIARLGVIFDRP